jgi:hypothetical protein
VTAVETGTYPAPVLAAAVLAAHDVSFLLVGSAALWLHGEPVTPADADAVIEPDERNLEGLAAALVAMALRPHTVPRARDLPLLHLAGVSTCYGRLDCLLERGRLDWDRLSRPSRMIPVADVGVRVAALADTWALKHRYKPKHRYQG